MNIGVGRVNREPKYQTIMLAARESVGNGNWWAVSRVTFAIDQYAEASTGNRGFFLNKPHSIGGKDMP